MRSKDNFKAVIMDKRRGCSRTGTVGLPKGVVVIDLQGDDDREGDDKFIGIFESIMAGELPVAS